MTASTSKSSSSYDAIGTPALAEAFAKTIWDMRRGQWLVRVYEGNLPAIPFWRKTIARYTHDTQVEERRIVNGKAWAYFHFKNTV